MIRESNGFLSCENVTVSFDGFKAVNGMNLHLEQGELRFLIGPNGAGKTTMLDVICGKVKPASGTLRLEGGIDLTDKKEYQIAELGIGRKFQAPSIFPGLTAFENLELAMSQNRNVWSTLRSRMTRTDRERIERQLELIGLIDYASKLSGSLSHGQKQWLEIGMMLMQEPRVLLLDEPVAGMTDMETVKTGELLIEIARDKAVVVVEHDMEFVRHYASKVTVMHEGKLLKEGTMKEVQADQLVAEVYLGKKAG
ncbi:urea ABC transporter ATP-binding protein UrtD [Paenibacillus sp. J5C_2022]|uniref:urea ABC transporter ATP-binding protein UrtD n=1 Tax=Paenibacillus sp. J5C2022 TaxID=2977129 RepID=UPI0021CE7B67|nr:urea ABC transporter ATP-binding protein UrtD [Paenibacillus sp. J5C2022]MCU6707401.1 urea ABC transporter ATP-binding protein UrtD [Paenibacillus sp. J5C2022]